MTTLEDKKRLFVSLLYIKSEAQVLDLRDTSYMLDQSIEYALGEIGESEETLNQLKAMRSFINQATKLPPNQLSHLVELIDYFDGELAHH